MVYGDFSGNFAGGLLYNSGWGLRKVSSNSQNGKRKMAAISVNNKAPYTVL